MFVLQDEFNEIKFDFIYDDDLVISFFDKFEQKTSIVEEGFFVIVLLFSGTGSDYNVGFVFFVV